MEKSVRTNIATNHKSFLKFKINRCPGAGQMLKRKFLKIFLKVSTQVTSKIIFSGSLRVWSPVAGGG